MNMPRYGLHYWNLFRDQPHSDSKLKSTTGGLPATNSMVSLKIHPNCVIAVNESLKRDITSAGIAIIGFNVSLLPIILGEGSHKIEITCCGFALTIGKETVSPKHTSSLGK